MKAMLKIICMLGLLSNFGCEANNWGPEELRQGKRNLGIDQLKRGRTVYANYCAGCHGESGDGEGPAARFLEPKPRDFKKGRLKFAAVESGEAPRDEDYLRVINHGLSGTAMPSFRLLSTDDKQAVTAYIKSFYPEWSEDSPGAPIVIAEDPYLDDPADGIAEGLKVYHGLAKCWSCHPAYTSRKHITEIHQEADLQAPDFRANLYASETKDSQWGAPIRAPDFYRDRIKTGFTAEGLVRVISSGIGGTAMPTWAGSLESEQLWGLAYYVRSLALKRGTVIQ